MYSDLHSHLGSSCSAEDLWQIAHEQGIALPYKDYNEFEKIVYLSDKIDHSKYLEKFNLTQKIQSTPYGVELSVYRSASNLYINHNVTNIEFRFNPMLRNFSGLYDLDAIILSAIKGKMKAESIYPIKIGIIIETARNFNKENSLILADKAYKYSKMGIVGFDMSGEFKDKNFDTHLEVFKSLESTDIGITIHAGETRGSSDELDFVLNNIKIDRIGHGIRIVDNDKHLELVSEKGICLEICPTSNIVTDCVTAIEDFKYIFDKLNEYKILYTINTDGFSFLQTSIRKEFKILKEFCGVSDDQIEKLISNSFRCSFNHGFRSDERKIDLYC